MKKTLFSLALAGAMTAAQASPLSDYLDKLDRVECPALFTQRASMTPPLLRELAPVEFWLAEYIYGANAALDAAQVYHCQLADARISRERAYATLPARTSDNRETGTMNGYGEWYATQQRDKAIRGPLAEKTLSYVLAALGAKHGARGDAFTTRGVEAARQAAMAAGLKNPPTDEAELKRLLAIIVNQRLALVATMPEPFKPLTQGVSQ